uniref:Secreted protein n=1 Tax=Caenorhabditis japonica TaxID=281687 RepID=A0A8R1IAD8_CAEJA
MRNFLTLSLICLHLSTVTAFFFGGGSGAACGCAAPACSPPPPPSGCAPPARAVARGAKTMVGFCLFVAKLAQICNGLPRRSKALR